MTPFSPLASLPNLSDAASAVETGASKAAAAVLTGGASVGLGGLTLSGVVIIVLGLLLIGAGLFSMQKTREIIVQTGKAAAAAAA